MGDANSIGDKHIYIYIYGANKISIGMGSGGSTEAFPKEVRGICASMTRFPDFVGGSETTHVLLTNATVFLENCKVSACNQTWQDCNSNTDIDIHRLFSYSSAIPY